MAMELLKREAGHRILAIGEYIINGGFVRRERADSGIWKVRFAVEGSVAIRAGAALYPGQSVRLRNGALPDIARCF